MRGAALTQCTAYATPRGSLRVDTATVAELHARASFDKMSQTTDEDEHSLEMHLPYLFQVLSAHFAAPAAFPPLVPILVGATAPETERAYGAVLAPYLADPTSVFVVSSDFCHWGSRFRYTYYEAQPGAPGVELGPRARAPSHPPIFESIAAVDRESMDAVESGSHDAFLAQLERTGNTVCGRHPIGIVLAAVQKAREAMGADAGAWGRFRFVRYERNTDVTRPDQSSVSYCSAFAVL